MTKRRTIEIIVETEELLVVNQRSRAISLKCPECGALVEGQAHSPTVAGHYPTYDIALELPASASSLYQNGEGAAQDNPQLDPLDRLDRLLE